MRTGIVALASTPTKNGAATLTLPPQHSTDPSAASIHPVLHGSKRRRPALPSSDEQDPSSQAGRPAQQRSVHIMPPGRKSRGINREPTEEITTDIERERAQTIMRNNQVLRSLGITTLASIVNSSITKSKGRVREESDPLYEPEDMEETRDDVHDEAMQRSILEKNTIRNTAGTRGSKRVSMPPVRQDQSTRMTRQRMREVSTEEGIHGTTTNAQEDLLLAVNCSTQDDEQIQTGIEGVPSDDLITQSSRGRSMGRELDRMCRGLNSRIPLVVAEGKRRPDAPMQAAKLASEGGILLRQHVPIYTHWKEYKKEYKKDETLFKDFMGKMGIKFTIDPKDKVVEAACFDLIKTGQRQLRHKLKRAYFDGVPANEVRITSPVRSMTDEQWIALVELWSSPKHKERCAKNIGNRSKVQFAHRIGSRCFIAHTHVLKQNKYKDVPPTEIDLFKELHCSSKTGFNEPMKEAIDQMDTLMAQPTPEGEQPKTPAEIFAHVWPSSKFLGNVGLEIAVPKRSATAAARVQELEIEIAAEKEGAAALRDQLHGQQDELEVLKMKVGESEEAREKQAEEIENLKKQAEETNSLLRRLFTLNKH